VVVENFAPGAMARIGLSYDCLQQINQRLIYAVISGFGKTGPLADRLAFDIIAQATGGIMAAYERPDRPPPIFFADLVSGAYCANGILLALLQRERTGAGQMVDVSMQDVMYFHHFPAQCHRALEEVQAEIQDIMGKPLDKMFSDPENPVPFWYSYKARDGYAVIVALTDGQWDRLLETVGRPDLVGDPRFSNIVARVKNAREGLAVISPWMAERTVAEIVETMHGGKVPCGPVLDKAEVNVHPQLQARRMLLELTHPRLGRIPVPGCPVKLTDSPGHVTEACPDLGAHAGEILKGLLSYSTEEVARLRSQGVI
jgi:crotonobetainyl-CoA:carnitine CoA-transferase CaiB-like acyl-CoA transferase